MRLKKPVESIARLKNYLRRKKVGFLKENLEVWCRRGDTNSFNVEIAKFARKFAECVDSLGFPFSAKFLFSLYNSLYSLSCSLVIDTKQTPNFCYASPPIALKDKGSPCVRRCESPVSQER